MTPTGKLRFARFLAHDWTKVGAVILAIFGAALAGEHRMTVNEQQTVAVAKTQTEQSQIIEKMDKRIERAEERQFDTVESLAKTAVILNAIEKRHQLEDEPYHKR